jgi:hypothetical protein
LKYAAATKDLQFKALTKNEKNMSLGKKLNFDLGQVELELFR